jgi:hypothetical protein
MWRGAPRDNAASSSGPIYEPRCGPGRRLPTRLLTFMRGSQATFDSVSGDDAYRRPPLRRWLRSLASVSWLGCIGGSRARSPPHSSRACTGLCGPGSQPDLPRLPLGRCGGDPALGEQLPFRPFVPRVEETGFRLLGTRTLVLAGRAAAVIGFSSAGHLYSLVSLPDPGNILDGGEPVALEGHPVRVVQQEYYTLVLWSVRELVYVMIADDDRDELLEYAALCVQQMRPST